MCVQFPAWDAERGNRLFNSGERNGSACDVYEHVPPCAGFVAGLLAPQCSLHCSSPQGDTRDVPRRCPFEMSLARRPFVVLLFVSTFMAVSGSAGAQAVPAPAQGLISESPAFYAVVNGAIGGVSAAVRAWHGNRSVRSALIGGTAGGLVTYGGMRMIGQSTPLRVPGLMLTGLGASLARNAGAGVPALSRVVLPMPLGSLELGLGDSARTRYRFSASSLLMTSYEALGRPSGASLDIGRSLASWTPVFMAHEGLHDIASANTPEAGQQFRRVIILSEQSNKPLEAVMRHEAVHVAQEARDEILFANDIGDALLARGGSIGRGLSNVMSLDLVRPINMLDGGVGLTMHALHGTSWIRDTYDEREAYMLSGERPCSPDGRTRCSW